MLILVVDDDPDDIELFLEAVGEVDNTIECMTAENGEEALRLLKSKTSQRPDFIFLDLNMPRLNGKQLLAYLKNKTAFSDIPVSILTTSKLKRGQRGNAKSGRSKFYYKT